LSNRPHSRGGSRQTVLSVFQAARRLRAPAQPCATFSAPVRSCTIPAPEPKDANNTP
jgi:hypothetical protein